VPLFGKKTKIALKVFCEFFYREVVADSTPMMVPGTTLALPDMSDINSKAAAHCLAEVVAVDPTFSSMDTELFEREIAALRLECFALAWEHKFTDDKRTRAADQMRTLPQALLMREYLVRNGQDAIWAAMLDYNQAVARSSQKSVPTDERKGRAVLAFRNSLKFGLADTWITSVGESHAEACGHALNLFFTEEAWASGWTGSALVYALLRRTGRMTADGSAIASKDASSVLLGKISGMYEDVKNRLSRVEIV